MLSEGGVVSRARHEWTVEVYAMGPGPWSVDAPRLAFNEEPYHVENESLGALLAELRVASGDASFELRDAALRMSGTGDATVSAVRTAPRGTEGFTDRRVSNTSVSRAQDTTGPLVQVTWSVDLSGGRGHTCWAQDPHSVDAPPGETRAFPRSQSPTPESSGRLWQTVCVTRLHKPHVHRLHIHSLHGNEDDLLGR